MERITLDLDEGTLKWAREEAQRRGLPLARFLSEYLGRGRREDENWERAASRYLQRAARPLNSESDTRPVRDDLYDCPLLR